MANPGSTHINPMYISDSNHNRYASKYAAPQDEAAYREWIHRTYRPVFRPFEANRGIPKQQLYEYLVSHGNGLKPDKLDRFINKMDADLNGYVTYQEFFNAMITLRKSELRGKDSFVFYALTSAVPAIYATEKKNIGERPNNGDVPESYLSAYNCRPPPLFIPLMCVAEVVIFAIYAAEINRRDEVWNQMGWATGTPYWSPLMYNPQKRRQFWRFASYALLHQGYHHVLFNVIMQLFFGVSLETVHKFWRVAPVYCAGVLAGALASSIGDPAMRLVGASGGVYALIGAHYALVVMNWEELQHDWLRCADKPLNFALSGVVRLLVLTLLLALDFGVALYQRYGFDEVSKTSFAAHIGGLIAGILVGIPLLKNLDKKPWENWLFWISAIIFVVLLNFAVFWNVFYKGFPTEN